MSFPRRNAPHPHLKMSDVRLPGVRGLLRSWGLRKQTSKKFASSGPSDSVVEMATRRQQDSLNILDPWGCSLTRSSHRVLQGVPPGGGVTSPRAQRLNKIQHLPLGLKISRETENLKRANRQGLLVFCRKCCRSRLNFSSEIELGETEHFK